MIHIKVKGSIFDKLCEIREDLQSSISYAGGTDLEVFKFVEFVKV